MFLVLVELSLFGINFIFSFYYTIKAPTLSTTPKIPYKIHGDFLSKKRVIEDSNLFERDKEFTDLGYSWAGVWNGSGPVPQPQG